MRRFMFFAMIFAGFMLVSCGNEVNTVSDNEGTNDLWSYYYRSRGRFDQ